MVKDNWCWLCDSKRKYAELELGDTLYIYRSGDNQIIFDGVQAKFCPLCGKELKEIEREDLRF